MPGKKTVFYTQDGEEKKKVSKSERAGLHFPVGRINRHVRKHCVGFRVSDSTAVFIAAVLEYLVAEVCELSGNAAKDNKRVRINSRHIQLAVGHDEELKTLLHKVTISQGGVLPFVHPALTVVKPSKDE